MEALPDPAAELATPAAACVWHLTLAYDGTAYHGWQLQPDQPTLQAEVQERLRRVLRNPQLRIAATSRTDAGVHALDQHISFPDNSPDSPAPAALRSLLNRWLPADIRVLRAERREPGFNARFGASAKAYVYVICPRDRATPFLSRYAWVFHAPLELEAMRRAAAMLVGELDFASFGVNPRCEEREGEPTVRRLFRVEVVEQDGLLYVVVLGESFLYKMVRSIVGHLVHVGRGSAPAEATREVLAARDRRAAADSAPAQGLFLAKVFFPPEDWRTYRPVLPPPLWR